MGYGMLLLYKILVEKDLNIFKKINPTLLSGDDNDAFNLIYNYFKKYNELPPKLILEEKYNCIFTNKDLEIKSEFLLDKIKEDYSKKIKSKYQQKIEKSKNEQEKDKIICDLAFELNKFWNNENEEILEFEDYLKLLEEKYNKIISVGNLGIITGYPTFDNISGGLLPSEIYLVLGRLKQGKSQLLISIVNNIIKQNKKVLFISMEMPKTQIFDRILGIRLRTNPNNYRLGRISPFALNMIKELNIDNLKVVEGQFKATISEIYTIATIEKPDLLVIDGAYLIKLETKASEYMSKPERLEEVMKTLKSLAHNLNIPIMASFQLSRESSRFGIGKAGKETIDKIQWSDSIGQIMTSGLAIYDDKDNPKRKLVEIIRGRHGEDGEFFINWDFDIGNFSEIEEAILQNELIDFTNID